MATFGTTQVSSAGTSTSGDDSIWEYDCPDWILWFKHKEYKYLWIRR